MLDINEIMKIIPQRAPFLMIDRVEEYVPGQSCIAYKNVCITGAVAILSMEENKGKNALFGGIDKLRFKKTVVPGDTLKLEVKIIKQKGPIGVGEAVATVDGKVAAKGELTFAVVDNKGE